MLDDAGRDFGAGGELRKNVKIDPTDESRSGAGQARESQSDKALGLDGNITRRDFPEFVSVGIRRAAAQSCVTCAVARTVERKFVWIGEQ